MKNDSSTRIILVILTIAMAIFIAIFAELFYNKIKDADRQKDGGGGGSITFEEENRRYTPLPYITPTTRPTEQPVPTATTAPTATAVSMPTHIQPSTAAPHNDTVADETDQALPTHDGVQSMELSEFRDEQFGFTCVIPAAFIEYNDTSAMYAVMNTEKNAKELINVYSANGSNIVELYNDYIYGYEDNIEYKSVDADSFFVSLFKDDTSLVKNCIIRNGYIYSVEFVCNKNYELEYKETIFDIVDSLRIY